MHGWIGLPRLSCMCAPHMNLVGLRCVASCHTAAVEDLTFCAVWQAGYILYENHDTACLQSVVVYVMCAGVRRSELSSTVMDVCMSCAHAFFRVVQACVCNHVGTRVC